MIEMNLFRLQYMNVDVLYIYVHTCVFVYVTFQETLK
jgi:hypothetical protein